MIKTVLIFNRHGNIRFFKTFTPIDVKNRTKLKQYLYLEINKRTRDNPLFFHIPSSEFYEEEEEVLTVIYRKFATLYFVFICDDSENILSVIDFIHVFVEVLDNYFNNVCELDIVFHFNEVHDIFKEIVHNGIVIDTSVSNILENITEEKNKAANESSLMIYGKDKIDKNQSIRKFIEHSPYQVEKNYASIVRKIRSKL
ncbi:hypothetical protein SNEBB_004288 [Seison nebaliae]|nr:hypothetical protein SNEBB_004288 [Seison nebaliae]